MCASTPYGTSVELFSVFYSYHFHMFPTHQEKKYPFEPEKVTSGRVLICAFGDDSGPNWLITVVSVSYANEDGISDSD